MAKIDEVLNRHWKELKDLHPGVLNVQISEKWVNGVNTHQPSITVYVAEKLPMANLSSSEKIPGSLEDIPVDVVEFKPTTWKIGKTSVSEMHPAAQKRLLGAHRNPKAIDNPLKPWYSDQFIKEHRAMIEQLKIKTGNLIADWLAYCSAIQNQKNCGSCVSFGNTGIWEAVYRLLENNPNDSIKLSEAFIFFCLAGANCETGSDCPTFLNYAVQNGTCLEKYCPYVDHDQACHAGLLPGYDSAIYKLASWNDITDLATIRQLLTTQPLVACMDVPQSFMSYQSGVYKRLGDSDPILGGHCTGNIGLNDTILAYHARNSWDVTWGEKGYFWIGYGECGFDSEAWQLVPILLPNPPTPPTPSKPCCPVLKLLNMRRKEKKGEK